MNHLEHSFVVSTVKLSLDLDGYETVASGAYFIGGFAAQRLSAVPADRSSLSLETGELLESAAGAQNCVRIEQSELIVIGSDMNTQPIYYIVAGNRFAAFNDLFLARWLLPAMGYEVRYSCEARAKELIFFDHVSRLAPGQRVLVRVHHQDVTVRLEQFSHILERADPPYADIEQSKSTMFRALDCAVGSMVADAAAPCIALSGGIDSGTVAALAAGHNARVTAFSLATDWGNEFAEATHTADFLGLGLERIAVSAEDIAREIPRVIRFFHFLNAENVEIALVAHCLHKALFDRDPSPRVFLTGYGSDLLNAGGVYACESYAHLEADIRRELARTQYSNEFSGLAALSWNVRVRHPFWDSEVIRCGVRVPPQHKLHDGLDKYYLREMMSRKLPQPTVRRTKLGAHRGTGLAQHLAALFGGPASYKCALQDIHRGIFCHVGDDWMRIP
jgi:asparagine synthetase B (glutamine-hydrolysing)